MINRVLVISSFINRIIIVVVMTVIRVEAKMFKRLIEAPAVMIVIKRVQNIIQENIGVIPSLKAGQEAGIDLSNKEATAVLEIKNKIKKFQITTNSNKFHCKTEKL